jgi:hypothetical protein
MVSPDAFPVKAVKSTPFTVQGIFPKIYARSKVPLFATSESPVMFCPVPQVIVAAWEDARAPRLRTARTDINKDLFMEGFMFWGLGCLDLPGIYTPKDFLITNY